MPQFKKSQQQVKYYSSVQLWSHSKYKGLFFFSFAFPICVINSMELIKTYWITDSASMHIFRNCREYTSKTEFKKTIQTSYPLAEAFTILGRSSWQKMTSISNATNGGGRRRVPFTIKRGQGSYKLYTQMIYKSTKQIFFFLSSWQKNSFNRSYNRQTISFFSLWFAEWPENGRENAYRISIFLDLSKKQNRKRVYSLIFQLSY